MKLSSRSNYIITGFALFSMFFGAGNIVFPLYLGAMAAEPLYLTIFGFVLTGVGIPFLGLIALSLYKGDYWKFFKPIGSVPAFLIITFIILIIGPLFATPRVVVVSYQTVKVFLPEVIQNVAIFNAIFCIVALVLSISVKWMIRVLGLYLTPLMLLLFFILIAVGIYLPSDSQLSTWTAGESVKEAIVFGYGTMDLLGAVFFAQIAYFAISKQMQTSEHRLIIKESVKASFVAGLLLMFVYISFIFLGFYQASILQNIPQEKTIQVITSALLGKTGSLFICISVTIACLSTAVALIEVSTNYVFSYLFLSKIPRTLCAVLVTLSVYVMSHLGFDGIMAMAYPILVMLYPALIVYCVWCIVKKFRGKTEEDEHLSFADSRTILKGE